MARGGKKFVVTLDAGCVLLDPRITSQVEPVETRPHFFEHGYISLWQALRTLPQTLFLIDANARLFLLITELCTTGG